jgi:hypothetical protein
MSLQLTPSRDSGVSGTATITDVGEGVRVELNMRGLPEAGVEHINHFHAGGTCTADRAGNVAPATIPLKTVVAKEDGTGSGTTTLEDATLDSLFDPGKDRYIALHSRSKKAKACRPSSPAPTSSRPPEAGRFPPPFPKAAVRYPRCCSPPRPYWPWARLAGCQAGAARFLR